MQASAPGARTGGAVPGFLDRLLKRFSGREVELPFDPAPHLRNVEGFLRPDWDALRAHIQAMPEDQRDAAWAAVLKRWLREQAPLFHPSFAVHESENLVLLSALTPGRARLLLEYAESALQRILKDLAGAGRARHEGPLVILHFRGENRFSAYMAPYGKPETDWTTMPGLFLDDGHRRIVLMGEDQTRLEAHLPRQLARAALHHLPLPLWLGEGLPLVMQARHSRAQAGVTPEELQHVQAAWKKMSLQPFWSGEAFLKGAEAYVLAWLLCAALMERHSGAPWRDFLLEADRADGGAAAARKHLGRDLDEAVAEVLGA